MISSPLSEVKVLSFNLFLIGPDWHNQILLFYQVYNKFD